MRAGGAGFAVDAMASGPLCIGVGCASPGSRQGDGPSTGQQQLPLETWAAAQTAPRSQPRAIRVRVSKKAGKRRRNSMPSG